MRGKTLTVKSTHRIAFTAAHCVQSETTCNMSEDDLGGRFFVYSGMYTTIIEETTRKGCRVEKRIYF